MLVHNVLQVADDLRNQVQWWWRNCLRQRRHLGQSNTPLTVQGRPLGRQACTVPNPEQQRCFLQHQSCSCLSDSRRARWLLALVRGFALTVHHARGQLQANREFLTHSIVRTNASTVVQCNPRVVLVRLAQLRSAQLDEFLPSCRRVNCLHEVVLLRSGRAAQFRYREQSIRQQTTSHKTVHRLLQGRYTTQVLVLPELASHEEQK